MSYTAHWLSIVIACLLSVATIGVASAQDSGSGEDRYNQAGNLAEIFSDREAAERYLAELRADITEARGNPAKEESALAAFGRVAYDYASMDTDGAEDALRREALHAFAAAADLARATGRIRYSWHIATLAYQLNERVLLDNVFQQYLQNYQDQKGRYLALTDYASALAKFEDDSGADRYFIEAVRARSNPEDGLEARMRFALHLRDTGRAQQSLDLLDDFDASVRAMYPLLALFRQALMHSLGSDTTAVDEEISRLRERLNHASGIGPLPKLTARVFERPQNVLGLPEALAFAHTPFYDDSRFNSGWITLPPFTSAYTYVSAHVVNAAEVLWNEARGESATAQRAVLWAVRNRAMINMNGCDAYPGAASHGGAPACWLVTPGGPQPEYEQSYKRWSCALHGGTYTFGDDHFQMNDGHVDLWDISLAGFIDMAVAVINGWYADPSYFFLPEPYTGYLPDPYTGELVWTTMWNWWSGNPSGAQEWRGDGWSPGLGANYCAANYTCKTRHGNVGGSTSDPGNVCPSHDPNMYGDNFFWGRQP